MFLHTSLLLGIGLDRNADQPPCSMGIYLCFQFNLLTVDLEACVSLVNSVFRSFSSRLLETTVKRSDTCIVKRPRISHVQSNNLVSSIIIIIYTIYKQKDDLCSRIHILHNEFFELNSDVLVWLPT